jgi:hypothetical protein
MRAKWLLVLSLSVTMAVSFSQHALADPCGMVPPIYPNGQMVPITRVGIQQTYVFYKDGIETFVIRPGFSGKVDEFGMLIPFPTPPAVRKVPDHIFQHIAAAVDPPEVIVDLRPPRPTSAVRRFSADKKMDGRGLEYRDAVKVIRQEAVGMYEVAVLEAGSAAALKRWMDDHGYKYPKGMDAACEDYVDAGWCFVAVKTKVGQKDGVNPKPGLRDVTSKLPKGSTFDGQVQGMGFRFEVDDLVVPMRLSTFNEGELRNVVYLLTDGPKKIRAIPEEYVVRQITGDRLYKNLTEPLPVRIINGTEADLTDYWRRELPKRRDPVPKNGAAAELFASDILSAVSKELALPHEEREKELLRIGERLGLRGGDIDKLNTETLTDSRRKTVEKSLSQLKTMTLTVVDGDFPRDLLRRENLKFSKYTMPARRNQPNSYDAKLNAPAPKKQGVLILGALAPNSNDSLSATSNANTERAQPQKGSASHAWLVLLLATGLIGAVIGVRAKGRRNSQ